MLLPLPNLTGFCPERLRYSRFSAPSTLLRLGLELCGHETRAIPERGTNTYTI